jgi:CubicO group peptidase (beta-lactamase class C family)
MIRRKSLVIILLFASACISFAQNFPFPESSPEAQGIPSEGILNMVNGWEKDVKTVHSFVLLRHGVKVSQGWWTPYKPDEHHILFSLSKSFTSAGIGFAIEEKKISLYDQVISFFPDDLPENPSENLKQMRVIDLLTMSTGQRTDAIGPMFESKDSNLVKTFLSLPVEQKPGTLFIYNTGATYMLSAIIQKVTGQKLVDYLKPRLFDVLDIKPPVWEESAQGISWGGFGLFLPTEDIAKFGQLYLQKGLWNGKQVIPKEWVEKSVVKQVSNGSNPDSYWDQGYGFQFWRNIAYGYRGDGAFGQFCLVLPEFDLVLAINSGTNDMHGVMKVVWQELLPLLRDGKLDENPAAQTRLKEKLGQLTVPTVSGKEYSSMAKKYSGKTLAMDENLLGVKSVTFSFTKKMNTVSFIVANGGVSVPSGFNQWAATTSLLNSYFTPAKRLIASNSAWTSDNTFEMDISYKETEQIMHLVFRFDQNGVTMEGERNAGFGEKKIPAIKGHVKGKKELVNQ